MVNKALAVIAALIGVSVSSQSVRAAEYIPPMSISEANSRCDAVVLARLQSIALQTEHDDVFENGPAHYTFRTSKSIRGTCPAVIDFDLGSINIIPYGQIDVPILPGHLYLLTVNKTVSGGWSPVEEGRPFIPIADQAISSLAPNADVDRNVYSLMAASLQDAAIRRVDSHLLRDGVPDSVIPVLRQYLHDDDLATRDNILYALISHGQIDVIDQVARLEAACLSTRYTPAAPVSIGAITSKAAIPALNSVLLTPAVFTRINASLVLQKIANNSSIPYLLIALDDPEPQGIVRYAAYYKLVRLVPSLGNPVDFQDFCDNPQSFVAPIYQWWSDELAGVHAGHEARLGDIARAKSREKACMKLFAQNALERQRGVMALQGSNERLAIPFLMLSVRDPNNDVAYDSYQVLSRLITPLPRIANAGQFRSQRQNVIAVLRDWWTAELAGRHLSAGDITSTRH